MLTITTRNAAVLIITTVMVSIATALHRHLTHGIQWHCTGTFHAVPSSCQVSNNRVKSYGALTTHQVLSNTFYM